MVLFFLLLGIGVLAVTFVVASGAGDAMDEPDSDTPPPGVPREGPLTAEHLGSLRLPGAVRGYRMDVVDRLLDRLQQQLQEQEASSLGTRRPAPPIVGGAGTSDGAAPSDRV